MAFKGSRANTTLIRLGATGFATFVTSAPETRALKLLPFKFHSRGEGFARVSYYRSAIATIREYHRRTNDRSIFRDAVLELQRRADDAETRRERGKLLNNIAAIEAYERIYGERDFDIVPSHRLTYVVGPIAISASPDLWAVENGIEVLIKIGVARKQSTFIDILLFLMRKAAVQNNYRVRAKNVVYLDITNGKERVCNSPLTHFNSAFSRAAREIAQVWPTLMQKGSMPQQEKRV